MPFPFFNLPILVQCKILRNYVSSVDKIHSLALIPQFSDLLEMKSSWVMSEKKLEFLKWIRLFKPGFYFYSVTPLSRIHISFDEINLKMSICYLTCYGCETFHPKCHLGMRSCSQVLCYLTKLKKRLISDENVITYHNKDVGFVTINHNSNTLYRYDNCHKIENDKCLLDNHEEFIIFNGKVAMFDGMFLKFSFLPYQWNYNLQKNENTTIDIFFTVKAKDIVEIEIKEGKKAIENFFQRLHVRNLITI